MSPLLLLLLFISSSSAAPNPVDIGVILDPNSSVGKTCQVSLALALSDFYSSRPNSTTKLRLLFRHSPADDVVSAASAAVDLISTAGVAAILGPQTSSSASFVADIGAKSHVPIVSFSATSPSISTSASPYFVRAAVADSAAAAPIAAVVQHFKWRRVVPVYEDSDFGSSFVSYLVDALDAIGSQVPYRARIPVFASDYRILAEMYRLKTMQTRVFVVHAKSNLAARVFAKAKKAGLMDTGYVWIVTDGVTGSIGSTDSSMLLESMQGVIGVEPSMPKSNKLRLFKRHWRREFLKQNPNSDIVDVSTFGIWAYDAFFALAMAAEASQPLNSASANNSQNSLSTLPVSKSGPKFLESIQSTAFLGLAGEFRLIRRELNPPAFKIVNIIGEKGHGIGFWTPPDRLTRRLKEPGSVGLGPVLWPPGDSLDTPKGFVLPTSGERMTIAVPGQVEPGFHAFLNAKMDPMTNETTAGGFVIEVFEAAVRRLPYALPFEYVLASGEAYTTLVQQVPKVSAYSK